MKILPALILALTMATPAFADSVTKASQASVLGGLSVVAGSFLVISSPFIVVGGIVNDSAAPGHARVSVTTADGTKEAVSLPQATVAKAKLAEGDKLTLKATKTGAILSKNETPLAYLVTPENAKLSHSHELAR